MENSTNKHIEAIKWHIGIVLVALVWGCGVTFLSSVQLAVILPLYLFFGLLFWWLITRAKDPKRPTREEFQQRAKKYNAEAIPLEFWPKGGMNPSDSDIYTHLFDYYLYQDQSSWSRTQILVAVEAGVLVAGYKVERQLVMLVIGIGSIIVLAIWFLILRDWQIRDQNLDLLDTVQVPKGIIMAVPAKPRFIRGSLILPIVVWILLMSNLTLVCWRLSPISSIHMDSAIQSNIRLGIPTKVMLEHTKQE